MLHIYVVILSDSGLRWVHIPESPAIDKELKTWRESDLFIAQVYSKNPPTTITEELEKIYRGISQLCSQSID